MTSQTPNKHRTNSFENELKSKHFLCLVRVIQNVFKVKETYFMIMKCHFGQKCPEFTNFKIKNFCLVEQQITILKNNYSRFSKLWLYIDFNPNDSCVNQLISITHCIFCPFDANSSLRIRGVFLDLSLFFTLQKWSFLLRMFSVNVTKSAGNCGFGHVYWRNP